MPNKESSNIRQIQSIAISEIQPDAAQIRKEFSDFDIDSLAKSIEQHGQLYPILVEQADGHGYKLIDGERRWRAFGKLSSKPENQAANKYATIETIIIDSKSELTGLLANIARKEYNPMEYADALLSIKQSLGKKTTDEDVGKFIGKSRVNVTEYLKLHELPDEIQEKARNESVVPFDRQKNLAQSKESNDEKIKLYDKLHALYKAKLNGEKTEKKEQDTPVSNRATRHYLSVGRKLSNLKEEIESLSERTYEAGKEPSEDSKKALITELQGIVTTVIAT